MSDTDHRARAEAAWLLALVRANWGRLSPREQFIYAHKDGQREAQQAAEMWERRARTMEALAEEITRLKAELKTLREGTS